MNQTYLKEHIKEELDGAKDYIMRAIEIKAMDPNWGKLFYNMSAEELSHATNFYNMSIDYYNKVSSAYKETPKYIEDGMEEITEMYMDCSATIKKMHEMYNR